MRNSNPAIDRELDPAQKFNKSWQKRALDLCITIPGLLVISPLLILTAILIKIDSPGPIIFRQKRVGKNGRIFDMYKFRSMYHNADQTLHQAQILAYAEGRLDEEVGTKIKDDPRITPVGKIIRKTSIDELPQLLNVIIGNMSLVGPRPVPIYEAEKYKLWHSERLTTLPGLTGLWQVNGRGRTTFDEQLRMDIEYIRTQSLWLNIKILFLTIPAVFSKRGAA